MSNTGKNNENNSNEISVNDVLSKLKATIKYIKNKWLIILTAAIIGGIAGLGYSIIKQTLYTASCNFVLDEGGKGALSQYAGIASLAGIDVNTSGGMFEGDNIIELYKSRVMLEKTLLTNGNFNGKQQLLIERYINHNKLRDQWRKKDQINNISFTGDPQKFSRQQDSIITDIVAFLNKKVLYVGKNDKKLDIITVTVTYNDELFAKEFTNKLVETVNNFYVLTKTKKTSQSVQILQRQADSIRVALNYSISGVASSNDSAPNANPLMSTLRVPSQKKQVDVQYNTVIYGEIIRNLEAAKISLRQETPLIQVIDGPVLPLTVNKIRKTTAFFLGVIITTLVTVLLLIAKKLIA